MKTKITLILLLGLFFGCEPNYRNPIEKLNDVVKILQERPFFEYVAYYDIKQDGIILRDTTNIYIEKSPKNGSLPLHYAFESSSGEMQLFDGQDFYTIINTERVIVKTENPPSYLIESNQGLLFSPFYIQTYLTYLIENDIDAVKYLGDTLVNNKEVLRYEMITDYIYLLGGRIVQNGDLLPNQMKAQNINKRHILTIDAESKYPISIKEFFSEDDYIEVSYSTINSTSITYKERAKVIDNSKYLSLSMADYMQIQMSKQKKIVGNQAEDFTLLGLFPKTEVRLSSLQDSPVLLEFWFPGCGFCIEAIPSINNIFEKYSPKGLKIFGIEFSDASVEHISRYIEKNKVIFPILSNGKSTALEYGVNSGPTFVLLDKNHKVVYFRSGLDHQELYAELDKVTESSAHSGYKK